MNWAILQARIETVEIEIHALRDDMRDMRDALLALKNGWRAVLVIVSLATSLGASFDHYRAAARWHALKDMQHDELAAAIGSRSISMAIRGDAMARPSMLWEVRESHHYRTAICNAVIPERRLRHCKIHRKMCR